MKRAVITGKRKAEVVEASMPRAKEDWVLVKVHAAPMCTEYKMFTEGVRQEYLGHEAAGEVVEIAQPGKVNVGDRVVVMPQYPCGVCELCIAGDYIYCENCYDFAGFTGSNEGFATFAQYLLKPSWLLPKIPDGISYEKASLACCGLGPSFGAYEEMGLSAFDTVLITGLGPVGIGAIINALYRGARVIAVESLEYRANLAKALGVDAVLDPRDENIVKKIKELCGGRGPDCALDCSGVPAAHRLCIDAIRRRGQVAFIGECNEDTAVRISPDLIRKGIRILGSWHYNLNVYPKVMNVIQTSPLVDQLISHVIPMSRIQEAFEISASPEHAKIILKPWE
jgi:L-iditol 2-dehydrogenase